MSEKLEDIYKIKKIIIAQKKKNYYLNNIQKFLLDIKNNIIEWEKFNKFFEKTVKKESKILDKKILEKQNEIDSKKNKKFLGKDINGRK